MQESIENLTDQEVQMIKLILNTGTVHILIFPKVLEDLVKLFQNIWITLKNFSKAITLPLYANVT
ncbi:hypothetical protein GA842_06675 [Pediococcus parvulus]|uniref:Uncharacterized protein n=1 Tax=Pediococcus parvulus TaxID=54062 RepID=A0AAP5TB65_9LACO|nr:hypothetical protein [Pediococcus parvulus]MDV7694563.1 hypothetical protein [Pediococcus parvulus]